MVASAELAPLEEHERITLMRQSVARGVQKGLGNVRERFDQAENPDDQLPYHNENHTVGVIRRTQAIVGAVEETAPNLAGERELLLATLAASFHDTVQNWEERRDPKTGLMVRKRFTEANERASADEALAFMHAENASISAEIFTAGDMAEVERAIMATVPDWDSQNQTVVQRGVNQESSVVVRAVTLADLGLGGMEPEEVVEEGRRIFREEQIEITQTIRSGRALTDQEKALYRSLFIQSSHRQLAFIQGRAALFENEIAGFPPATQAELRTLFGGFEAAFSYLEADIIYVEALSYEELVRVMGY